MDASLAQGVHLAAPRCGAYQFTGHCLRFTEAQQLRQSDELNFKELNR